jgi:hypothetical protein
MARLYAQGSLSLNGGSSVLGAIEEWIKKVRCFNSIFMSPNVSEFYVIMISWQSHQG